MGHMSMSNAHPQNIVFIVCDRAYVLGKAHFL
jgi:hypothetical protein